MAEPAYNYSWVDLAKQMPPVWTATQELVRQKWDLTDSVLSGVAVAVVSSQDQFCCSLDVFPGCVAYKSGSGKIVIY